MKVGLKQTLPPIRLREQRHGLRDLAAGRLHALSEAEG